MADDKELMKRFPYPKLLFIALIGMVPNVQMEPLAMWAHNLAQAGELPKGEA